MVAMSPYRGGELVELPCPRCKKTKVPPLDVAPCSTCGGTWVTAFAASEVLGSDELRSDPVTRWWRVREPCPACGDKMLLHGKNPGLFQGCELHGYFIDADIVAHTKLGKGIDHAALERKRADTDRVDAEREAREKKASQKAADRAEIERREAALDRMDFVREVDVAPSPEALAKRQTEDLYRALASAIGPDAAELLLRRVRELEARVAELERR
jgi:hypothetical protein